MWLVKINSDYNNARNIRKGLKMKEFLQKVEKIVIIFHLILYIYEHKILNFNSLCPIVLLLYFIYFISIERRSKNKN